MVFGLLRLTSKALCEDRYLVEEFSDKEVF